MRLAVAAVLVALALAGCGTDDADEASGPATVTVTETETVAEEPATTAETETETEPASDCSTSGLRVTLPEQDLPEPVSETRQQVFDAAVACDYDTLEQLASEEGFTFSYGAGTDASDYWR